MGNSGGNEVLQNAYLYEIQQSGEHADVIDFLTKNQKLKIDSRNNYGINGEQFKNFKKKVSLFGIDPVIGFQNFNNSGSIKYELISNVDEKILIQSQINSAAMVPQNV